MGITDEINELEDSLKGVDKLLVQSNKDALMLKSSLSGINTFVSGKNYEIISRFLSGTGAWKVLNKAKATVLTMIQLVSVQERAALQDNLRMKEMAKIIRERKELIKLESQFKQAALNKDKQLIEQLKEKSDVFAAQATMVGDDKALAQILDRIKKSKGLLENILGKGKVSGKTITEDPLNKSILSSNIVQTAAIAGGFLINKKFLNKISKNTEVTSTMLKTRKDMLAALEVDFQDVFNNMPSQTVDGTPIDYQKEFLKYANKMSDIPITTLTPKLEDIQKELGIVAESLGGFSLSPRKLRDAGLSYIESLNDLSEETYLQKVEEYYKHKKMLKDTFKISQDLMDKHPSSSEPDSPFNAANNLSVAEKLRARFDEEKSLRGDKRITRIKKAFGLATTDEEKAERGKFVNTSEKFANRRKTFKRLYQRPILSIIKSIQENGSPLEAMKSWVAEGGTKLVEFTGKLLMFAKKAFVSIGLAILALFLLYRAFKSAGVREKLDDIWEQTKSLFTMMVLPFLELVESGIGDIVAGFEDGKFFLVIEGLLKILGGIIMASLAIMGILLYTSLQLIWEGIKGLLAWAFKSGDSARKTASKIAYIASAIIFLVAFFTGGWVIALVGAIVLGVAAILESAFSFFADGGVTTGGLSVVGEKGPELVKLPTGSRVYSNADSGKMVAAKAASSGGNTINVHVNGRVGASDAEIRDIANKVAKEINIRMNQTSSTVSMI
tara:strand:- start:10184 stop:12361 length:2178 start_codon:yes stop_codon:yes gene_type:complete